MCLSILDQVAPHLDDFWKVELSSPAEAEQKAIVKPGMPKAHLTTLLLYPVLKLLETGLLNFI